MNRKTIIGIYVLALIVRLLYVFTLDEKWYFFDTVHYHTAARHLVDGEGFGQGLIEIQENNRAYGLEPTYPVFLAGIYAIFGESFLAVRLVQSVLMAFVPLLIFLLAARLWSKQTALIAAGIAVVYPIFVFLSGFLYPTGLATLLLLLFAFFNIRYHETRAAKFLWLATVAYGLVVLTLPVALVFAAFWALWMWRFGGMPGGLALLRLATIGALIVLMLTPWTVRNYQAFGKLVPIRAYSGHVKKFNKRIASAEVYAKVVQGDTFRVRMTSDQHGHHFDCYYNGQFLGRLTDANKERGNGNIQYAGLMLASGYNNAVDRFELLGLAAPGTSESTNHRRTAGNGFEDAGEARASLDTVHFVDEFDAPELDERWIAPPAYRSREGNLVIDADTVDWGHPIIFNRAVQTTEIAVTWGKDADNRGINQAAFAVMLDADRPDANGYMVWRNPIGYLILWTIENGRPGHPVQDVEEPLYETLLHENRPGFFARIIESPGAFLGHYFSEFLHFWSPQIDRIRSENRFTSRFNAIVGFAAFAFVLIFGLVGILYSRNADRARVIFLLSLPLAFALGYSFFMTQTRYRIPVEPYLVIFAANGISVVASRILARRRSPAGSKS